MIASTQCGLNETTQQKLIEVFSSNPAIQKVLLYGSRAMGNYKPGSDIDLTVIAPSLKLNDLFRLQTILDDPFLPYKIDLSLYHLIDNDSLLEHIQRVGLSFYQK